MRDVNECREHAERCMAEANQTEDPVIRQRLIETAQGWMRLAADFAKLNAADNLLKKCA